MKIAIGFLLGIIVALSASAFADAPTGVTTFLGNFMIAGGYTDGPDHQAWGGKARGLRMTPDGRVLAKCD